MFRPWDSSCHPHRLFLIIIESYAAMNGMWRITLSSEDSGDTMIWLVRRTLQKSHVGQAESNNMVVLTRTPGPVIWIMGGWHPFLAYKFCPWEKEASPLWNPGKTASLPPWSWFPPAWWRQSWQKTGHFWLPLANFLQAIGLTVPNDSLGNIRDILGFQVAAVLLSGFHGVWAGHEAFTHARTLTGWATERTDSTPL